MFYNVPSLYCFPATEATFRQDLESSDMKTGTVITTFKTSLVLWHIVWHRYSFMWTTVCNLPVIFWREIWSNWRKLASDFTAKFLRSIFFFSLLQDIRLPNLSSPIEENQESVSWKLTTGELYIINCRLQINSIYCCALSWIRLCSQDETINNMTNNKIHKRKWKKTECFYYW